MNKYQPLADRLAGRSSGDWRVSFAELETLLGFPLPKAARAGGAWWANTADKAHNRAWLEHGWRVGELDRAGETVTFRRETAPTRVQPAPAFEAPEASRNDQARRTAGRTALIGGAVAVAAGIGAVALRLMRQRK